MKEENAISNLLQKFSSCENITGRDWFTGRAGECARISYRRISTYILQEKRKTPENVCWGESLKILRTNSLRFIWTGTGGSVRWIFWKFQVRKLVMIFYQFYWTKGVSFKFHLDEFSSYLFVSPFSERLLRFWCKLTPMSRISSCNFQVVGNGGISGNGKMSGNVPFPTIIITMKITKGKYAYA